jgi:hypothetical protein
MGDDRPPESSRSRNGNDPPLRRRPACSIECEHEDADAPPEQRERLRHRISATFEEDAAQADQEVAQGNEVGERLNDRRHVPDREDETGAPSNQGRTRSSPVAASRDRRDEQPQAKCGHKVDDTHAKSSRPPRAGPRTTESRPARPATRQHADEAVGEQLSDDQPSARSA